MKSHEVDYRILGNDLQLVEIELDQGETVVAEAGAMTYMEEGVSYEAKMGDGSQVGQGVMGKLMGAGKRMISGESLFMTHFTSQAPGKRHVAFGAPYPGKIIPIDLAEVGGDLMCQKDAFLCAALGTKIDIAFTKRMGAGFFGGEGFVLQRLTGDGKVFLHVGGTVVRRELSNEKIMIDTGCLAAFTPSLDYSIEKAGNMKSMFFGGEGMFLATVQGSGTVWIQSLPFSRLADRILANAPSAGGAKKGEGSILGTLGNLMGD